MSWVHIGNAALIALLAVGVSYELGAQHQANKDQALVQHLLDQHDEDTQHQLIAARDTTYFRTADAMGLQYFNALRDDCIGKDHGR